MPKVSITSCNLQRPKLTGEKNRTIIFFNEFCVFPPLGLPCMTVNCLQKGQLYFNQKMESCLGDTKDGSVQYITLPPMHVLPP